MEFLDLLLENLYKPLYALSVLIALVKYPKYYNTPLGLFPVILMYTLLTEILGYITKNYEVYNISLFSTFVEYNVIIYNIYNIIFFCYFFYVYWSYIDNKKYKNQILYGGVLFLIITVINTTFESFTLESQLYSYLVGGLLIIYCTILFFLERKKIQEKHNYRYASIKWISIGLFIFYLGYLPIKASRYYNYLYKINEYIHLRRIHLLLICILYSCFIIGLYRMRRKFWI
ncbi:hypothetical protein KCTC52924_00345 [Arenibacter antarcticus]|nr:hypothetical protein [Arenibacter sp. H213]